MRLCLAYWSVRHATVFISRPFLYDSHHGTRSVVLLVQDRLRLEGSSLLPPSENKTRRVYALNASADVVLADALIKRTSQISTQKRHSSTARKRAGRQ
jgi:hypothetical protein